MKIFKFIFDKKINQEYQQAFLPAKIKFFKIGLTIILFLGLIKLI